MSKVKSNILYLSFLQVSNYVFPLITLPYLIRTLGIDKYGLIAFSMALTQYFVLVTEYGFNLSGPRNVALKKNDSEELSRYFCSVMAVKSFLMVICLLVLMAIIYFFDAYKSDYKVYLASSILVVGNVMFPAWFYQGIEKMGMITFMNVMSKTMAMLAIFSFVNSPDDLVLAIFIQSSGNFIGGALGLLLLKHSYPNIRLVKPKLHEIIDLLKDGWHIFTSQAMASLVNNSNVFILGLILGSGSVGHYAIAERITKSANNMLSPVCNSIYPNVSRLFADSPKGALRYLIKTSKFLIPLLLIGCLILFIYANEITWLISGLKDSELAMLLRVMAFIPLTVFIDNIFGTQILLNIGKQSQFAKAIFISGLVSVVLTISLVSILGELGSAITYLLSELILLILMMRYVFLSGILNSLKE